MHPLHFDYESFGERSIHSASLTAKTYETIDYAIERHKLFVSEKASVEVPSTVPYKMCFEELISVVQGGTQVFVLDDLLYLISDEYVISVCANRQVGFTMLWIQVFGKTIESTEKIIGLVYSTLKKYIVERVSVHMHWWYSDGSSVHQWNMEEDIPDLGAIKTNYPFLQRNNKPCSIDTWINAYLSSKDSLLVLMGEPGTGKTRFIQYLLRKMYESMPKDLREYHNLECQYTSDKRALESGDMFFSFLAGSSEIMVLEDIDFHLESRKMGNTSMYYLLNVTDGLITNKGKKVVVSTNLETLANIDSALIRKGRCFDILNFRKLTYKESVEFMKEKKRKDLIKALEKESEGYSLADLYSMMNS